MQKLLRAYATYLLSATILTAIFVAIIPTTVMLMLTVVAIFLVSSVIGVSVVLALLVQQAAPPPLQRTARGFEILEFIDDNGQVSSLQKSSAATDDLIWLGRTEARMHLTKAQVKRILPYLQQFVETGELT